MKATSETNLVKVCLGHMEQIRGYWDMCAKEKAWLEFRGQIVDDSQAALMKTLETERRLERQLDGVVKGVQEWCRLASMCIKGMEAWELADAGEGLEEAKAKKQMFDVLKKVRDGTDVVATGMPSWFFSSREKKEEEDEGHLMLVLARRCVKETEGLSKYVGEPRCKGPAEMVKRMDKLVAEMERVGKCLDKVVEKMREVAGLYEGVEGFLGRSSEGVDEIPRVEAGHSQSRHKSSSRDILEQWWQVLKMVDALLLM